MLPPPLALLYNSPLLPATCVPIISSISPPQWRPNFLKQGMTLAQSAQKHSRSPVKKPHNPQHASHADFSSHHSLGPKTQARSPTSTPVLLPLLSLAESHRLFHTKPNQPLFRKAFLSTPQTRAPVYHSFLWDPYYMCVPAWNRALLHSAFDSCSWVCLTYSFLYLWRSGIVLVSVSPKHPAQSLYLEEI